MKLSIQTNAKIVRQGLENLVGELPKIGRLRLYKTTQAVVAEMKNEPPELPQQHYIRTGTLSASWYIETLSNGYAIRNDATGRRGKKYPILVVGNARGVGQASIHVGRWPILRQKTDEQVSKLPAEVVADIKVASKKFLPRSIS